MSGYDMDDQQFLADLEARAKELYENHRATYGPKGFRPWDQLPDKTKGVWCQRAREEPKGK
jgi:hypothetical protein